MDASGLPRTIARGAAALTLVLVLAGPASAAQDPLVSQQWALGTSDPAGIREAWKKSDGRGVVVAVLDTGVQLDHPDLAGSIWTNPREIANGVDDDGNGFVDDIHGANIIDGNSDVSDDLGHGTEIAGIIAARAGNGIGLAGVAPQAQIMPVKVFSSARGGSPGALARGIRYAVDHGASILSVSINSDGLAPELADAVRYAGQRGATIVNSAGNDARDIDKAPAYPASMPDPAVLTVTAGTEAGDLKASANYGPRSVDLAAPGSMVLTTEPGSGYTLSSGTSVAAPFVSGALALLASARPDLSQAQLRDALLATARHTPAVAGKVAAGSLDVGAALHQIVPGPWGGSRSRPHMRLRSPARTRAGRRATLSFTSTGAGSVARWTVSLDGRKVTSRAKSGRGRATSRIGRVGKHRWTVVGYDASGRQVARGQRNFRAFRAR